MSMSPNINDRELKKFRDKPNSDESRVAVELEQDKPALVETSGVEWDTIVTTYPAPNKDLFTYQLNTVTVQTILVTYDTPAKKNIILVQKVRY